MPFNPLGESADTFSELAQKSFLVLDDAAGNEMRQLILAAKQSCDSVGGVIECMAINLLPVSVRRFSIRWKAVWHMLCLAYLRLKA